MTANELIERYVYAATKRLPKRKNREDIANELKSLIDDMLTERCGEMLPEEKDVRVVIAEIGTPAEVYRKYSPNPERVLISAPYYSSYILLLKIIVACSMGGLTIAFFILNLLGNFETFGGYLVSWLSIMATTFCGIFTVFTIMFAVFSRKNININIIDEDINCLEPVPKKSDIIPRWESIAGIIMCIIFSVILLAVPNIIFIYSAESSVVVPMFNVEILRSFWLLIVIFCASGIIRESLALIDGKYTKRLLVTAFITNIISGICIFVIFTARGIINPDFLTAISNTTGRNALINGLFGNFNLFFAGIIVFALLLDTGEIVYKYFKSK